MKCEHIYGCNAEYYTVYRHRRYCHTHYILALTRHEQVMRIA
jgi:hypothetical protein